MRLVADESVDVPIVQRLRSDGHEVVSVSEVGPGLSDDEVLDIAKEEDALLLTADKDFGELVYRQGKASSGVLLIRLAGVTAARKAALASALFADHEAELKGAFTVLSPGVVRIRSGTT